MAEYVYKLGSEYSVQQQVAFHNLAFQQYIVEFTLGVEELELAFNCWMGHVSYLSVYMLTAEGDLVGLARTALRGSRAWCAGFALVPEYRIKGVGKLLMQEYLRVLKQHPLVRSVQLEVFSQNIAARRLYERVGFTKNLHLEGFEFPEVSSLTVPANGDWMTELTDRIDVRLPWLQHTVDYSWQRELSTLINRGAKQFTIRRRDGTLVFAMVLVARKQETDTLSILAFAFETPPTQEELVHYLSLAAQKLERNKVDITEEPNTRGNEFSVEQQVEFQNLAFQQYITDSTITVEGFELELNAWWGHVSYLSVYMFTKEGELVAFSRTALRGSRAWCAGLAVVPEYRSKGVGKLLMAEYLRVLRTSPLVQTVQLDVYQENPGAIKLYERSGFTKNFEFSMLSLDDVASLKGYQITNTCDMEVSKEMDVRLPWLQHTIEYPWRREFHAVISRPLFQITFKNDAALVLGMILCPGLQASDTIAIFGWAFNTIPTRDELATMIYTAATTMDKRKLTIPYESDNANMSQLLCACGFKEGHRANHMVLLDLVNKD
ncbi:hypothetical protein BZG36_04475 [Bifiguratus adelaidae]|uniref:N-acetyltransferase domain-containing protein n=1 Tax=Bifiguratus adelaidae TaxID=1938954 RepID=A0A261XVJ6_9FUNG|nr:hypothetical protein BZG36_04475 [Bifiguratus adelaidae]